MAFPTFGIYVYFRLDYLSDELALRVIISIKLYIGDYLNSVILVIYSFRVGQCCMFIVGIHLSYDNGAL